MPAAITLFAVAIRHYAARDSYADATLSPTLIATRHMLRHFDYAFHALRHFAATP